ncbi:Uma2 family endonuclease [Azospirillum sp.]|uniref:Uma2 family endonuclease n=1 Tax=Azospirillum sp. TaxID=34012 RepID=UPI002D468F31|nr:Uma2 family endonuclease [Azospirillum sp.]HYD70390.1 Uma2 family endonuclease [Azospirillum sp.]
MNALPKRRSMTLAEFLDWEERQEERHEFIDGEITAMVGGTILHSRIAGNLHVALRSRLRGSPCEVFQEGIKVVTASGAFYPDAFVTCTKLTDADRLVAEPAVIFEVLSPTTRNRDLITKNRAYRTIGSLSQYVVVSQEDLSVQSFLRKGEDWTHQIADGADGILAVPSLGFAIPLSEIYERTELLAAAQADEA